jgi:hypothetical protein
MLCILLDDSPRTTTGARSTGLKNAGLNDWLYTNCKAAWTGKVLIPTMQTDAAHSSEMLASTYMATCCSSPGSTL